MVQESDDFFNAPRQRYAALNRYIVDIAYSNLRFGFELARAKTFSDVLNLQAEYWRRLFDAFYRGEFRNWPVETGEPASPVAQDERPTGEHRPPQKARKTDKRPATATALKKPEQKSEQGGKRSAAKHASAVERKAEKIRSEPKERSAPRRKADSGAMKRPARQDSRGRRDEILFARLDDSAVRFHQTRGLAVAKWEVAPDFRRQSLVGRHCPQQDPIRPTVSPGATTPGRCIPDGSKVTGIVLSGQGASVAVCHDGSRSRPVIIAVEMEGYGVRRLGPRQFL